MRIISGKAGGLRLQAPVGAQVRPTEDRVKESLFSMLGDLGGLTVLDLFSGTGALGLEALSRGASRVLLVERDQAQAESIRANLSFLLRLYPEAKERASVLVCDVACLATQLQSLRFPQADLLLADPPYHPADNEYGGEKLLLDASLHDWLAPSCRLVLEHETGTVLPWSPFSRWKLTRQKTCGLRTLSFAELLASAEEDEW